MTGCSEFDFAARGGGVVKAVAAAAGRALSPCIAIAGRVVIGSREMRTMGIDAAYAVRDTHPAGADAGRGGRHRASGRPVLELVTAGPASRRGLARRGELGLGRSALRLIEPE